MYEVEIKFPAPDTAAIERRLAGLAAVWLEPVEQIDRYFAHPCRDFARTDEALRLRRDGDAVAITWKGPRIDAATKTRRAIELPLAAALPQRGDVGHPAELVVERWTELLEALGFRPVATVAKRRRPARVSWQEAEVEVVLDCVAGLGDFVELELQAVEADVPRARACLESLARQIGCGAAERRSYLELLLESRGTR
ncbi:MAG: class IV adenylate cyclase [Planctomycetia bacterium]